MTETPLSKSYDPNVVEPAAAGVWNEGNHFHAEPADSGPPFCIVIPPPNVTAALHMGHALNNTLQDIIIRWRRMSGDNTLWMPGTDHAGIATQTVVEKRVWDEQGKRRTDFSREQFVAMVQSWKDEYEATITGQLKAMGCSCDWQRQRFTMDEVCARAVRQAFFQLFKDGLIYRGKRLVNWDPETETALADDEVENTEIDGYFWYMKYPIVDDAGQEIGEFATVATTRPETMLGDTAVAVNSNDPPRARWIGRHCRLPIVNRIIPIIGDDYVVMPDPDSSDEKARYASGFLKVTPAHDPNDWEIGQRHRLDAINVMAPDATISDQHGWDDVGDAKFLLGLDRYKAREQVVDWFKRESLLADVKPYRHSVGHSYRSHVAIEPYLSDQWYVKVTDDRLAGAALRAMAPDLPNNSTPHASGTSPWNGKLHFHPARYARTFQAWHEKIRDWCISRQLWWGHRIPVWYRQIDEITTRATTEDERNQTDWQKRGCAHQVSALSDELNLEYVCVPPCDDEAQIIDALEADGFLQDPDVLDTWFSSALWPFSTLGWPDPSRFSEWFPDGNATLRRWNPGDVLVTGRDIISLWVSRMVMTNLYFRDCLPFQNVVINPMVQDGQGHRMSKSKGNGVDPLDIIHSHGADAMRYTLTDMTTGTQDIRLPVEKDPETGRNTSPKFDVGRNFCNKLWNSVRFALMNLQDGSDLQPWRGESETISDRWVLSRLAATIEAVSQNMDAYAFHGVISDVRHFFWDDLCDWYLELIKPRLRDSENDPCRQILAFCIDQTLRMLQPIVPFITEYLWGRLNEAAPRRGIPGIVELDTVSPLVGSVYPKPLPALHDQRAEEDFELLKKITVAIREVRNKHNVPPAQSLTTLVKSAPDMVDLLKQSGHVISHMANTQLSQIGVDTERPPHSDLAVIGETEIYVSGGEDEGAKRQRLAKRQQELESQIKTLQGRLANAKYVEKAPPYLVEQTRQQLDTAGAELAAIKNT